MLTIGNTEKKPLLPDIALQGFVMGPSCKGLKHCKTLNKNPHPVNSSLGLKDRTSAILLKVEQSGNGDYIKIQDAINAVSSNNSALVFISIIPGIYREEIIVPVDKMFITLSGSEAKSTIFKWWQEHNLNMHGPGNPSVALRVSGDKASFCACRITSYQDILFDHRGRHYCRNCYIEGAIDYASYTLFLFLIHKIFLSLSSSAMDWVKSQTRTRWIHGLSYKEAAPFLAQSMIDGQQWLRWPMASHFKCACTHIAEKRDDNLLVS